MKKPILVNETFSCNRSFFFLDYKRADNNRKYIQITRSDLLEDNSYKRWQVIIFENEIELFFTGISSLLRSIAYHGTPYTGVREIFHAKKQPVGIKGMEPGQRPREKMLEYGAAAMKNEELLAMLIGSGTPNETAVGLAGRILSSVEDNLTGLAELDLQALCRFAGMGVAKSCSIMAAMELARRMQVRPEDSAGHPSQAPSVVCYIDYPKFC